MRKILLTFGLFILFVYNLQAQTRSLNFECGGFVTNIYVAPNSTQSIASQLLFAKTDVGGVYKSTNNGNNWTFISDYRNSSTNPTLSKSELITQGFAFKPDDPQQLVAAWGQYPEDAAARNHQCVYYSTNGGTNWLLSSVPQSSTEGVWFRGDDFSTKTGGECIVFDPAANGVVYMGGVPKTISDRPKLYRSTNNGQSWTALSHQFDTYERINSIAMTPGSGEIWVGTLKINSSGNVVGGGIYRIWNNGNNFQKIEELNYVRRVVIKKINVSGTDKIYAFAAYNQGETNNGIYRVIATMDGSIDSEQEVAGSNFPPGGTPNNHFCTLTFAEQGGTTYVIAGRWDRPIKKSSNWGATWIGEDGFNEIYFRYNQSATYPNHQITDEESNYLYTGLSSLVRNTNTGLTDHWYVTGGAGLRISLAQNVTNGTFFVNNKFEYRTVGQSMTVVNDVAIQPVLLSNYFIPIADWTAAYGYMKSAVVYPQSEMNYDIRNTRVGSGNTYIGNARRVLYDPTRLGYQYVFGYDQYAAAFGYATMYERTSAGNAIRKEGPWQFQINGQAIIDAVIQKTANNNLNRLVVLLGKQYSKVQPDPQEFNGVLVSTDNGDNWSHGSFSVTEEGDAATTLNSFYQAFIPPASEQKNGAIGDGFTHQFNLVNGIHVPNPNQPHLKRIYLYLENGGLFISDNGGINWTKVSNVVSSAAYINEGCLRANGNKLYIAVKNSPLNPTNDYTGLFTYVDNGSPSQSWNFTRIDAFKDAEQVEAFINYLGQKEVYVWGKMTGDNFNRIYRSTNDCASWTAINDVKVNNVRSIRYNPSRCSKNEVWISTSGQGVVIYRNSSSTLAGCYIEIVHDQFINQNTELESDIIIKDSSSLTIDASCTIKMSQDTKIIVEEGGKLIINNGSNVTFTRTDDATSWGGIEFRGSGSGYLKKCTFEGTSSPIRIVPNDSGSVFVADTLTIDSCIFNSGTNQVYIENDSVTVNRNIKITNNTFNLPSGSQKCIYAENVFNLLVKNNTFNTGTGSFGIHTKNTFGVDPMSETPSTFVNIVGNTFYGGTIGMALMNAELIQYYVAENTFAGTANGYYGIITKKVYGRIKDNRFNNTNINQALRIDLSDVSLFNNAINGNEDNINVLALSTVNMAPIISGEDFIWEGGANWVTSNNANNIAFNGSGLPLLDYGKNCFNLLSATEGSHLLGASANTDNIYQCRNNGWTHITPTRLSSIQYSSSEIVPQLAPGFNCATTPTYDGYTVRSKENGISDTVWTSETGELPEQDDDEILYNQALYYQYNSDYVNAIHIGKSLIDNHVSSSYLIDAIWNMYACYDQLDTADATLHDELFSELKIYLENVISNGNYDESVESAAYSAVLMCETDLKNFNDAMDGYEFLAEYHPDPVIRLNASWDYEALEDLLNGFGGQGSSQKSENLSFEEYRISRLNRMNKIISGDPLLQKLKASYDENIINKYNATEKTVYAKKDIPAQERNTIEKKIYTQQQQTLMQRSIDNIRSARTRSKAEKEKKLVEDLILSGGMNPENATNGENTVPQEYKLHQNYPNPFNPVTTIKYQLPKDGLVQIKVYDIIGREVMTLVNEQKTAGTYETVFNATNFASGIYFYRIQSGSFVESKRMMLIK